MKKYISYFASIFAGLLLSISACALDLQEAKDKGLIGELGNGYVSTPQASPSADVVALIKDINNKRKAKYQELANAQGISLAAVEKLAGEKAFEKTASGHYIKTPGAGWVKK